MTLNFEGADLRDVVRNILGDIMGESYTIDPSVGGSVTIRTSAGIPREALPATLEMLLRMNGATMTKEAGVWKILPAAAAVRGNLTPQLGNSQRAPCRRAFSVQIVPLRYVGVRQMARLLEPFVKDQTHGPRRRSAQPADPLRHRARVAAPAGDDRHVRRQLAGRACRPGCSR